MNPAHRRGRIAAAFATGLALGAVSSAGIALLLYTGQGFLRAAGLLVSSTILAVAAGLWAGAPEPRSTAPVATRTRWLALILALIAGGLLSGFWGARAPLRELAAGGALAVLLALALPAYTAGALLAGLHARNRAGSQTAGALAAAATAGVAFGALLAAAFLIQTFEPYGIYYGSAALLAAASLLDRGDGRASITTGEAHMIGHVVIVTGAADTGQLGYTVARRFLDAGAHVVISARSEAIEDAADSLAAYGEVLAVRADLLDDGDVARLIGETHDRFGRLDALINVAGGLSVIATVEHTTPADWESEIERNAGTMLRVTRAALPLLRESRGAIVNFASPAALRAPPGLAAYSAAKAAIVALTRSLAIEEKGNGVRVNAIAPGTIDTTQNLAGAREGAEFVTREQVASVVLFLAGPASTGVTGETVHVLGDTIG